MAGCPIPGRWVLDALAAELAGSGVSGPVERVSRDKGPHGVLNRNDLVAALLSTRVADGHKHVQLRITLIDGHESAGWLTRVEVDRVNGTVDLVAERYQP